MIDSTTFYSFGLIITWSLFWCYISWHIDTQHTDGPYSVAYLMQDELLNYEMFAGMFKVAYSESISSGKFHWIRMILSDLKLMTEKMEQNGQIKVNL